MPGLPSNPPSPAPDRSLLDFIVIAVLLVLTALPDAMVVPLLEELLVGRYGVGHGPAHAFLSINLVGGLCAVPLLGFAARRGRPVVAIGIAAIVDALLLAAMWLPIGFGLTILLRFFEGVADVVVFAVVFDLVGRVGARRTVGMRFGFAAAFLSMALGSGAIVGGYVARNDVGSGETARLVFLIGAGACLLAGLLALVWRRRLRRLEGLRNCTSDEPVRPNLPAHARRAPLWPLLLIAASDRAVGGLLTGTLGLFLADAVGLGPASRGGLVGSVLLLMGLGAIPAGDLADRLGDLRVRVIGASAFGLGIAILPAAGSNVTFLLVIAVVLGAGGAVLLPTSLAMLDRLHRGLVGMGGFRAAGDVGFLLGVTTAGLLVRMLVDQSGSQETSSGYAVVFVIFGVGHLCVTAMTTPTLIRAGRAD